MRMSESSARLIGKALRSINGTQEDAVAVGLTLGTEENAQEFFAWCQSLTRDPTPQECFEKATEIAGLFQETKGEMRFNNLIPNDKCPECKKYRGRYTCKAYPTWVPDEATDGECPEFEQRGSETKEQVETPTALEIEQTREWLQRVETEAAKPGCDPFVRELAKVGRWTLEQMEKDCQE